MTLQETLQAKLAAGLLAMGLQISNEKQVKLIAYLLLIVKWNKEISPKGFGYASRSTFDGPRVWIADTGASYDLIGEEDIPATSRSGRRPLDVPVDINTANGTLPVTDTCPIQIKVLRSVIEPIILPCVPPVLSIGQRVMSDGFDFI